MELLSENGIAFLAVFFIAASVLGVLWEKDKGREIEAVGDRVACGLFAIPLISAAVHQAAPCASAPWVLAAPLPLVFYVALLAYGDKKEPPPFKEHFSRILLIATLLLYAVMAGFYAAS